MHSNSLRSRYISNLCKPCCDSHSSHASFSFPLLNPDVPSPLSTLPCRLRDAGVPFLPVSLGPGRRPQYLVAGPLVFTAFSVPYLWVSG